MNSKIERYFRARFFLLFLSTCYRVALLTDLICYPKKYTLICFVQFFSDSVLFLSQVLFLNIEIKFSS